MIKILDKKHAVINGYLLDFNQVWAWYNSTTFPSHDPLRTIQSAERDIIGIPESGRDDWAVWGLHNLNNIGYYIPDEAFSEYPYQSYFYRDGESGKICYGEIVAKGFKNPYKLGTPTE